METKLFFSLPILISIMIIAVLTLLIIVYLGTRKEILIGVIQSRYRVLIGEMFYEYKLDKTFFDKTDSEFIDYPEYPSVVKGYIKVVIDEDGDKRYIFMVTEYAD